MASQLIYKRREFFQGENAFTDVVVWQVDPAVRGSKHDYKYRMAYVIDGVCVMRYDNEAGKGDHKHLGAEEFPVTFSDLADLFAQFCADVDLLRR